MRRGTPPPGRGRGVVRTAKRVWPVALEAWRRWDRLSPAEKERYRRMAGDYTKRGRDALNSRSARRRRR
jgi:hypothetical protein